MAASVPTWQLVLDAAQELTAQGQSPFSRAQLITEVRSRDPNRERSTLDPIIQGMTINASGGPRSACGTPLTRVGRGQFVLVSNLAPAGAANSGTPPGRQPNLGDEPRSADVLLVGCVKTKAEEPTPARDLYQSAMFARRRNYAEASGLPWFILSAEHGLVEPTALLEPYDVYLADEPVEYRLAWGAWVVARLQRRLGNLKGQRIEVHASDAYVSAIRDLLVAAGADVNAPLQGLRQGEQLSWYDGARKPSTETPPLKATNSGCDVPNDREVEQLVLRLLDRAAALTPDQLTRKDRRPYMRPGLYSWWVDEIGAHDLSRGLSAPVEPGLIYAGQAGAKRWPSGKESSNTLWGRLVGMHLGNKESLSTFRRTLSAGLASVLGLTQPDDPALTVWMAAHLRVIPLPLSDGDRLGMIEKQVLRRLDPPLNLSGMPPTPLRQKLSQLRANRGSA